MPGPHCTLASSRRRTGPLGARVAALVLSAAVVGLFLVTGATVLPSSAAPRDTLGVSDQQPTASFTTAAVTVGDDHAVDFAAISAASTSTAAPPRVPAPDSQAQALATPEVTWWAVRGPPQV